MRQPIPCVQCTCIHAVPIVHGLLFAFLFVFLQMACVVVVVVRNEKPFSNETLQSLFFRCVFIVNSGDYNYHHLHAATTLFIRTFPPKTQFSRIQIILYLQKKHSFIFIHSVGGEQVIFLHG